MKTYTRQGIYYRLLQPEEIVREGDVISYTRPSQDPDWQPVNSSIGREAGAEPSVFCFLRPIEPLLYHMIKAKGKANG